MRYEWFPGASKEVVAALQAQRAKLKAEIVSEVGACCECCNKFALALDLHEVWIRRSALPVALQHQIMVRGNCALVCVECHRGRLPLVETLEFKDRFERRLRMLGYKPNIDWWEEREGK